VNLADEVIALASEQFAGRSPYSLTEPTSAPQFRIARRP